MKMKQFQFFHSTWKQNSFSSMDFRQKIEANTENDNKKFNLDHIGICKEVIPEPTKQNF